MKILVTHIITPKLGGAHLYTQELTDALKINHNLVIINGQEITHNFDYDINSLDAVRNIDFDLIIIMQSPHFKDLNIKIKNARVINIIHSEVYQLDEPLIHNRAKYISVRNEIKEYLINKFNIKPEKITTLLNPINKKYYSDDGSKKLDDFYNGKFGVFACGDIGEIRWKAAIDFALFCKELNYKSLLMAPANERIKKEFDKLYDRVIAPSEDVNLIMQKASISGGILKGRTYWEAKLCGKPVVEYMVNPQGDILYEIYEEAPGENEINEIKKITEPTYVAEKIIQISKVEDNYNLNEYFDIIYNLSEKYDFLDSTQIIPISINNYWFEHSPSKNEIETLINFMQILKHAESNRYEKILIIQNDTEIDENINKLFYDKFHLFKNDWQILIFSNDFYGIALKEEVYPRLLNIIDFKNNLNFYITELIYQYKTYIFKDKFINPKKPS